MNREEFAAFLRTMCKKYSVKQKDLAEILGISCAAISQFMNGVSLPRPEQLVKMTEHMGMPAQESQTLLFRLLLVRNGMNEKQKIAVNDSWPLGADHFFEHSSLSTPHDLFSDVSAQSSVPLLYLEDMEDFTCGTVLMSYARSRSRRIIVRDFGSFKNTVIIKTTGDKLSLSHTGPIQLALTNDLPSGYTSLNLCRLRNGSYCISPGNDQMEWQLFAIKKELDEKEVLWHLPLLEMSLTPVYCTDMGDIE